MPIKNITGVRFGRLVAERRTDETPEDRSARWVCRCDCGNITEARGTALRYGKIKSCGCLRDNPVHNFSPVDLIGKRFGRLTVVDKVKVKNSTVYWRCACDCGQSKLLRTGMLTTSGNKSCGCMKHGTGMAAAKKGVYFLAFANGLTKFGRSAHLRKRIVAYRREFILAGGGVAFCAQCDDYVGAENRLIQAAAETYSRLTAELFSAIPLEEAKRLLAWSSKTNGDLLEATVLLTGPGPVSLLQR